MDLNKYQELANQTDQKPDKNDINNHIIPLLGVVGETGALISEFKKKLRDGESYVKFNDKVEEVLGNILWYVSNVATKMDFQLNTVAERNLRKINERFPRDKSFICVTDLFDKDCHKDEQIPRVFNVVFKENNKETPPVLEIFVNNKLLGDPLSDNAYKDDGYRYHDIFHFSYAAILGWSPVIRDFFKRKRKSTPLIDEVEDGARAAIIEEAISAFIYQNAKDHNFYEGIQKVDHSLIKIIKSLVAHLEVKNCKTAEWEQAILQGYSIFRELRKNRGGTINIDLNKREISYIK